MNADGMMGTGTDGMEQSVDAPAHLFKPKGALIHATPTLQRL
jgi:hypothetical protein